MVNEVYLNEDLCVASGLLAIFADKALLRIEKKKHDSWLRSAVFKPTAIR